MYNSERQAFHRNKLQLEPWYGYNEVSWNKQVVWSDLTFDYELTGGSYLWVFFAQTDEKRFAVRLSTHPSFGNAFAVLDRDGKFLTKISLLQNNLNPQKHQFHIKREDARISFFNNEFHLHTVQIPESSKHYLSFRSGFYGASVDNITARKDSFLVESENFSPRFNGKKFLFSSAISAVLLFISILALMIVKKSFSFKLIVLPNLIFQILLILVLSIYFAFDYYHWSKLYHYQSTSGNILLNPNQSNIESIRKNIFDTFNYLANRTTYVHKNLDPEIIRFHKLDTQTENYAAKLYQYIDHQGQVTESNDLDTVLLNKLKPLKIAFMGTSQTWGEGARNLEEKFISQSIKKLNEKYKIVANGINFSIPGSTSTDLLKVYKDILESNSPDILVTILCNNDSNQKEFEDNLEEIIKLNKDRNIKTLFIFEANSIESTRYQLISNHGIMKAVAKRHQIPVISLYDFIRSKEYYDSGLVWWDTAHMAPHGHNLTSDWLANNIADFTNGKISSPK